MRTYLLLALAATLAACDSTPPNPPPSPQPPVTSVLVAPGDFSLVVGQTRQLTATPVSTAGQSLSGRDVEWATSDSTIATVSTSGIVTAIGSGAATITATSEGQSGYALVTVREPVPQPTDVTGIWDWTER